LEGNKDEAVTPELEIAWARAISRAADDPAFRRRLEADPKGVLEEFGVEVPAGINMAKDLHPALSDALPVIERQAKMVRAALGAGWQSATGLAPVSYVAPASVARPVSTSCALFYASAQPYTYATPNPPPAPFHASILPSTFGSHAYTLAFCASFHASQVATTRAATERGPAPPQRFGGPPSGGILAMW
jgi:hypothetical protein